MSDIITNTTSTNESKVFNVYVSKSTTAGTALVTRGSLNKTDPTPTVVGLYILEETGIYPNLGNIDAQAGKLNYASFDGTTWSLIAVDIPSNEINFSLLQGNSWDGSYKKIILTEDTNINLITALTYGILEIEKDYYNRFKLNINGKQIKMPYGEKCLISFVKVGEFFNFYAEKFSQKAKELSTVSQPIRNKVFTGVASDVVTSNDTKYNLTQFSVSFSAKISANNFVAISKGTNTTRNWDIIFTNYNTGGLVDLQFNVGNVSLSSVGNPLNSFINIVATFNGSTAKLYVNDILKVTKSATLTAGGSLNIGQVLNLYSNGEIKDLFMVNKELSQSEITEYQSSNDRSPLNKTFASSVVEYFSFGTTNPSSTPSIVYSVPNFSIYPKPILMRGSRDWNSGDIANPDLTYDEKKLSGYNYILQYSAYGTTATDSSPKWRMALAFSNNLEDPNSWIVDKDYSFEPITGEGYISSNGSIVIKDGWFYHFYQTGNSGDINSTHIRAARSRDLKTWERLNAGNPIIQRTQSYENSGAYDPMVRMNENGLFEMVYCTYNGSQVGIGYATSSDGISWSNKKLVVGLNSSGTSEPCICRIGERYLISCDMYVGAVRNCYGAFWDGTNTINSSALTKIIDGIDNWNSVSCFDSYCFFKDDSIYCFFAGGVTTSNNQGLEAQIGFAKADLIYI